mgnify:CR=1 FL=1
MGGSEDGGSAWCGSRGETGGYRSDSIDRNSSIGIEHGDGDDGWSYPGCCAGSGGGEFERDGGSAGTVAEWVGGAEYADGEEVLGRSQRAFVSIDGGESEADEGGEQTKTTTWDDPRMPSLDVNTDQSKRDFRRKLVSSLS